jgi:hypothetical protein
LRRADRAGGEHDLATAARLAQAAILPPTHADGAAAVERDALDQTFGFEP